MGSMDGLKENGIKGDIPRGFCSYPHLKSLRTFLNEAYRNSKLYKLIWVKRNKKVWKDTKIIKIYFYPRNYDWKNNLTNFLKAERSLSWGCCGRCCCWSCWRCCCCCWCWRWTSRGSTLLIPRLIFNPSSSFEPTIMNFYVIS